MRYKLDYYDDFEKTLIFWLAKFMKFKLSSLSNISLKNPEILNKTNLELNSKNLNLQTLEILSKNVRNAGLIGINTYMNPLIKITKFLISYNFESFSEVDEEVISEILASATANLSDATKKNYRIATINFFKFVDKQNKFNESSHFFGIELKNWGGIKGTKGVKLPEFLTEDETIRFINGIDQFIFKTNNDRNKCLIKIILFTGIRVSEALNIQKKDITEENELFVIRIRGKGNKYRIVMIKKDLIQKYLQNMKTNFLADGYLFLNNKGTRLSQPYVAFLVEQILLSCGIRKEKNGPHMLRHTFATLLYKKHKDLILVQEALGHASLDTSRIYTHFDNDRLKLAAKVAENLAKDAKN